MFTLKYAWKRFEIVIRSLEIFIQISQRKALSSGATPEFYDEVKNEVNFIKLQELYKQVFILSSDVVEHWEFLFDDVDLMMGSFITALCDHYEGNKTAITPEMLEWLQRFINDMDFYSNAF